jgi:hypothetical protein
MNKLLIILLFIIASLLIFNGLINIVDDGSILAYDIASILSGFGFIITSLILRKLK